MRTTPSKIAAGVGKIIHRKMPKFLSAPQKDTAKAIGRTTKMPAILTVAVREKFTGRRQVRGRVRRLSGEASSRTKSSRKTSTSTGGMIGSGIEPTCNLPKETSGMSI
jgi:hypothetical protein